MSLVFAILRAPQVVQTQILSLCKAQEVFLLSLCSKRAYKLIKVYRRRERGQLILMEAEFHRLAIRYANVKNPPEYESTIDGIPVNRIMGYLHISHKRLRTMTINIGGTKVLAEMDMDGLLVTFWEDRAHGIKTVTEYVTRLFNMNIHELNILNSSLWLIDWINSRQDSLKEAKTYECERVMADEEAKHILANCKATKELRLGAETRANFCYTGEFQKPKVLRIEQSPWVTLENLKAMDSIEIYLHGSNLMNFDINLFLKHWLAGGSPRLRYACVEMNEIHFNGVFKDLTKTIVRVPGNKKFELLDGYVKCFDNTYEIERADGVKASIKLEIEWSPRFYFFVCPATKI